MGLGDSIVGVSDYCNYPEAAQTKPSVGGYWDPSAEAIVALNPDLVLTDGYNENPYAQLESLGIPVVVLKPGDIDGIFQDIRLLGHITATEQRAERIISDMQASIDAVVSTVGNPARPRALYVFDASDTTKPWTAGPGSFVDALLNMAGGENVAGNASGPWVQFNMEELVDSDPEIILLDASMGTATISPEALKELPGWKDLTAVKEDRIYTINGDLVNRSGPRIVQGLEALAHAIHPELF